MVSFIDLPPEMRNSIYDKVLTGPAPNLSVLRASKQLHEEAASYFYQHNVFIIDLRREGTTRTAILAPISDRYVKYLRHLAINICLSASAAFQTESAARIKVLASSGVRLTTLTINITSNASRILSSRIDDTVLATEHPLTLALHRLLASHTAHSMHVNLDGVWFSPGVVATLQSEFEGRLEVCTAPFAAPERALLGQSTLAHFHALGFDDSEAWDLQRLFSEGEAPSEMGSALSELNQFSPSEFLSPGFDGSGEEVTEDFPETKMRAGAFSQQCFDGLELDDEEEELTGDDDVEDEEMLDVDDFEAILGNLGDVAEQRIGDKDVCYLTNFAPEMLGRWAEGSVW